MKKDKYTIKSNHHQIIIQMDKHVLLACRGYNTENKAINSSDSESNTKSIKSPSGPII